MKDRHIYRIYFKQFIRHMCFLWVFVSAGLLFTLIRLVEAYWKGKVTTSTSFAIGTFLPIVFLLLTSIQYSHKQYALYLSIQARRSVYLKAMLLIGILGSVMLITGTFLLTQIFCKIGKAILPFGMVREGFELSRGGLVSFWGLGLISFAIGFFIGALYYRMNALTATCLLGFFPTVLLISILTNCVFQNDTSMYCMLLLLMVVKPIVGGIGQLIYIIIFNVLGCLLLYKAPIKMYAHDLL